MEKKKVWALESQSHQKMFTVCCLRLTFWPYTRTQKCCDGEKTPNTDTELTFTKGLLSNRQSWNLVITFTSWEGESNTERNAQNVSLLRGHCSYGQMWRRPVSQPWLYTTLWKHCKLEHSSDWTTVRQGHYYHSCLWEPRFFSIKCIYLAFSEKLKC